MVFIKIYGLDSIAIENISTKYKKQFSELLEIEEDEILFIENGRTVFDGIDQTNWYSVFEIILSEKYHNIEENIVTLFKAFMKEEGINYSLIFNYVHDHHIVNSLIKDQPKYVTESNSVNIEKENYEDEDFEDENKIFTGNAFKELKK